MKDQLEFGESGEFKMVGDEVVQANSLSSEMQQLEIGQFEHIQNILIIICQQQKAKIFYKYL